MEIRQRWKFANVDRLPKSKNPALPRSRRQLRAPENDNKTADGSLQGRAPHWMNAELGRDGKAIWAVG
jgi:hypothetical protein